jgi:hypothetical protein
MGSYDCQYKFSKLGLNTMFTVTVLAEIWHRTYSAGIFKQSMGARNRVGIGLSYWPARLHSLAELVPWNRFLGSLKMWKCGLSPDQPQYPEPVVRVASCSTLQLILAGFWQVVGSHAQQRRYYCHMLKKEGIRFPSLNSGALTSTRWTKHCVKGKCRWQGHFGKLSEQLLSTFSRHCFGLQIIITTEIVPLST